MAEGSAELTFEVMDRIEQKLDRAQALLLDIKEEFAKPLPDRLRRPPSPTSGEGENRAAPDRVLIIACGALAREVGAVIEANGLDHIDLTCLPAILHNRPEKIPEAVRAAIRANRPRYSRVAVAYADCGTGGMLDTVLAEEDATRIGGPHCYAFFSGTKAFLERGDADMDAFFLTDFLARQFEAFVIEPLGLDRHPELRDTYFGHYRRLVYLEQAPDPSLDIKARQAAERLGLLYEKRTTGYGDLASFVVRLTDAPAIAS